MIGILPSRQSANAVWSMTLRRSSIALSKVSVRNARRDAIELLKKAQKEGMPEDVQKDHEQLVQKETDAFTKKVDELVSAKEKEIMTV